MSPVRSAPEFPQSKPCNTGSVPWLDRHIVPINAMRGPRAACRGHLVKDDLASKGAERRAIEIKAAIELLVR